MAIYFQVLVRWYANATTRTAGKRMMVQLVGITFMAVVFYLFFRLYVFVKATSPDLVKGQEFVTWIFPFAILGFPNLFFGWKNRKYMNIFVEDGRRSWI